MILLQVKVTNAVFATRRADRVTGMELTRALTVGTASSFQRVHVWRHVQMAQQHTTETALHPLTMHQLTSQSVSAIHHFAQKHHAAMANATMLATTNCVATIVEIATLAATQRIANRSYRVLAAKVRLDVDGARQVRRARTMFTPTKVLKMYKSTRAQCR